MSDPIQNDAPIDAPSPSVKPGWQTTEFALAVVGLVFAAYLSSKGKDDLAALITSIAIGVYPAARTWVKAKAGTMAVLLALGLVLGCAAVTRGATNESPGQTPAAFSNIAYLPDRQTAALRSTVTAADSTTIDAAWFAANTPCVTKGRATIPVSARFSVASRTCVIRLVAAYRGPDNVYVLLGYSDAITLSGGSTLVDSSGKYIATTSLFDAYGATHVFVDVITAPASGNVDFWVGTY